jgi:hypothetical protein
MRKPFGFIIYFLGMLEDYLLIAFKHNLIDLARISHQYENSAIISRHDQLAIKVTPLSR